MKIPVLVSLLTASLVSRGFAVDAPPTDVVILDHVQVDAAFAKGMPLHVNSQFKVQAGRRVTGGNVEVHAKDTDILYITEGEATLVTGGQPVGAKTTGTDEMRADKITGGVTRHLRKGDVIVIPAGVPHWFSEVNGTFLYFVVKVTK
jgi:quercetin dioxygenase-like cupin family protein